MRNETARRLNPYKFTSCWIPNGRRGSPWGCKLTCHSVALHLTFSKHQLTHNRHSCSKGCAPPGWELSHLPDPPPLYPLLSRRTPLEFFQRKACVGLHGDLQRQTTAATQRQIRLCSHPGPAALLESSQQGSVFLQMNSFAVNILMGVMEHKRLFISLLGK